MAKLPYLVQYQGSKRNLAKHILNFLPDRIDRLVEPFAGTAAISVAMANSRLSGDFWLNDLNKALIQLLELAVEQPNELADFYSMLWNEQASDSVGHYFDVRTRFNQTQDPKLFLYLLARCVKGSVRYNSAGLFNQSPDKRRKGTQPKIMRQNLVGLSYLLRGKCKFTSLDYRAMLEQCRRNDFVYMDPPYQGVCGSRDSRYLAGIEFDEFVSAIDRLNERNIEFAVSYDGKLGDKSFGKPLPKELGLKRIEIEVGRSSQSTLLGRKENTTESLYLSPAISKSLIRSRESRFRYAVEKQKQLTLLEKHGRFAATAR